MSSATHDGTALFLLLEPSIQYACEHDANHLITPAEHARAPHNIPSSACAEHKTQIAGSCTRLRLREPCDDQADDAVTTTTNAR